MTTPIEIHGLSSELAVEPGSDAELFNLSGVGDGTRKWSHVLTRRAAHMLWYRLTWALFPEKSPRVTGMAVTAPLRSIGESGAVAYIEIIYQANEQLFIIIGRNETPRWTFDLADSAARQLWAALDLALYPAGWGGTTLTIKPN